MGAEASKPGEDVATHTHAPHARTAGGFGPEGVGKIDPLSPKQFVNYFATPVAVLAAAEEASIARTRARVPGYRSRHVAGVPLLVQDAAAQLIASRKRGRKPTAADLETPVESANWAASIRRSTERVDLNHFVLRGDTRFTPLRFGALLRELCMHQPEPLLPPAVLAALIAAETSPDPLAAAMAAWRGARASHPHGAGVAAVTVQALPNPAMAVRALAFLFSTTGDDGAGAGAAVLLRAAIMNELAGDAAPEFAVMLEPGEAPPPPPRDASDAAGPPTEPRPTAAAAPVDPFASGGDGRGDEGPVLARSWFAASPDASRRESTATDGPGDFEFMGADFTGGGTARDVVRGSDSAEKAAPSRAASFRRRQSYVTGEHTGVASPTSFFAPDVAFDEPVPVDAFADIPVLGPAPTGRRAVAPPGAATADPVA